MNPGCVEGTNDPRTAAVDLHVLDLWCSQVPLTISVMLLLSREPRNYRGKVLHLSIVDLEVGIPVAFA